MTSRVNGRAGNVRKSAAGNAGSARNALRHGLNVPLLADPIASAEVAALAREIAQPLAADAPGQAVPELWELAQLIAEAQLDLVRVRRARRDLICAALTDPDGNADGVSSRAASERARLLERAEGIANQKGPWPSLLSHLITQLRRAPTGPEKLARILGDLAPRLAALDRYERRARSRRMRASVAYDHKKMFLKMEQS